MELQPGVAPVDAPTPDGPDAAVTSKGAREKDPALGPKVTDVKTIAELFQFGRTRKGRPVAIPPSVRELLLEDRTEPERIVDTTRAESSEDPTLAFPLGMLITVERVKEPKQRPERMGRLRHTVVRVVSQLLHEHPVFRGRAAQEALTWPSPIDLTEAAAAISDAAAEHARLMQLKPAESRALRTNALSSLGLLTAIRWRTGADQLVSFLDNHVWQPALLETKPTSPRADVADPAAISIGALVSRAWRTVVTLEEDAASEAVEARESALRLCDEAQQVAADAAAEADRLRSLLDERNELVAALTKSLDDVREAARVQASHAVDDYERLRTRVVRRLQDQRALLIDGLHAVRNDRSHITIEYLERVVSALDTELANLQAPTQ